jgi:hypothetical protein
LHGNGIDLTATILSIFPVSAMASDLLIDAAAEDDEEYLTEEAED